MDRDRTQLLSFADALRPDAERMLRAITGFAELPLQEKRTSETLAAFLKGRGFRAFWGAPRFRAGKVIALGTPAEETGYGKARMVEEGIFSGVDAAMMVHASSRRPVAKGCPAPCQVRFTY